MADTDSDQKTEHPTDKHVGEAMDRGQFAKAPELTVTMILVAALAALAFTGRAAADRVAEFSQAIFTGFGSTPVRIDTVATLVGKVLVVCAGASLPMIVACAGAALLAGGLQTGFRFTPGVLDFNFDRLDVVAGMGRIFSKGALVHTAIDAVKLLAVGASLYAGARAFIHDPLFSTPVETAYLGRFIYQATTAFLTRISLSLGVLAAISYAYEKYKTSQDLKMTRQEVKDERRSSEGDGAIKGHRRRLARRLMQKQMLAAVPTADVIITNPTHYAVALKYERGRDRAPVVLAKGENRFAQRIKALAAEHEVPIVENKPVARMLFAMGRVGEAIPPDLYQAVARILAVVYRTHRYYFHRLKARRLEQSA